MSELETTYRRALRWYPKRWRTANEDALVGTLMDQADDESRDRPAAGELANLRNSGIATRLGALGRWLPLAVRQRSAVLTFGLGLAISAAGLVVSGWGWDNVDGHYQHVWTISTAAQQIGAGQGIYLVWMLAFVATLLRWQRATTALLLASIPASIAWPMIAQSLSDYGHPSATSTGFLALLAIVTIAGRVPSRRREGSQVAIAAGVFAGLIVLTYLLRGYSGWYWGYGAYAIDYFWSPLAVWLVLAGIPISFGIALVLWRTNRRVRCGATLLAASPLVPLGLFAFGGGSNLPAVFGTVLVTALVAAAAIGILRLFGLRVTITRT